MKDINNVVEIGRLTRDAELKYIGTGTAITKFSICINNTTKKDGTFVDEPSFFECILWGKFGESIKDRLLKGARVGISGHLKQERWQQEGNNRSKVIIVVDDINILDKKKKQEPEKAEDDFKDDIPF